MTNMSGKFIQVCLVWLICAIFATDGKSKEEDCQDLGFVPGYNLGGEGFDVVTMQRKTHNIIDMEDDGGKSHCRSFVNTNMNHDPTQKIPVAVSDWKPRSKCSASLSSSAYMSSDEFRTTLSQQIKNDWSLGLKITSDAGSLKVAGSQSRLAKFTQKQSKSGQYSFNELLVQCKLYDYSIDSTQPPLSDSFVDAVKALPVPKGSLNRTCAAYRAFIDEFGTHYFSKVTLGGRIRSITAIHLCKARSYGLSFQEISNCLSAEAKINMGDIYGSASGEFNNCQSKLVSFGFNSSFSSVFNKRTWEVTGGDNDEMVDVIFNPKANEKYIDWIEGLNAQPEVVEYSIKPLFTVISSMSKSDVKNAKDISATLKYATEVYIKDNMGTSKLCSDVCAFDCVNNRRPNEDCSCTCSRAQDIDQNCCPQSGYGYLIISDLRVTGVTGDWFNKADPYLLTRDISPGFRTEYKRNSEKASWDETWDFGPQKGGNTFTLELKDKDFIFDDSCGDCYVKVEKRINPVVSCPVSTGAGSGTIHFRLNFTCEAYYSGKWCNEFDEGLQDRKAPNACPASKGTTWETC